MFWYHMQLPLVCLLVLLCFSCTRGSQPDLRGEHQTRATLTWEGTVVVNSPIVVNVSDVLIISPGTIVHFAAASSAITVQGTLFANGTTNAPITFTHAPGFSGLWHGIFIESKNTRSTFQYCKFLYAETAIYATSNAEQGSNIDSCTFQYNTVGLRSYGGFAHMNILNSEFSYNTQYGLYFEQHAKYQLNNSRITNNGGDGVRLYVVWNTPPNAVISGCVISDNGRLGVNADFSYLSLFYSTISNNTKGGVVASFIVTIQYNNIFNNSGKAFELVSATTGNTYTISPNYWGTTNASLLAQMFPSGVNDPNLPTVIYSPAFNKVYPCDDCLVDVSIPPSPGTLFGNVTWTLANSPYIFEYDVVVTSNARLVIEPGVTVMMATGKSFFLDGTIISVGTPDMPITFTAYQNGNASALWRAFTVRTKSTASEISYSIFERLEKGLNPLKGTLPSKMVGCVFRKSIYGIFYQTDRNTNFENVTITQNDFGMWLDSTASGAAFTFTNSTIIENKIGIHYDWSGISISIYNSTIARHTISAFRVSNNHRITLKLYFCQIYRNRNTVFLDVTQGVTMQYCNFYDNHHAPYSPSPIKVIPNGNASFDFRYNYFGEYAGPCEYSQALSPLTFLTSVLSILISPVLNGPFETACTISYSNVTASVCQTTAITPQAGLRYDKCGVCGGDNSTCARCSDNALNPYTCADGSCIDIPSLCPTPKVCIGTKKCWNGACVTDTSMCPPFERCLPQLPKRCEDGTCVAAEASCSAPFPCLSPLQLCPDGSCASDCRPYTGCPANYIQCADGSCSATECPTGDCSEGQFLCFDGSCRATCPHPIWYDRPTSIMLGTMAQISSNLTGKVIASVYKFSAASVVLSPVLDSFVQSVSSPWRDIGFSRGIVSQLFSFTSKNDSVMIKFTVVNPVLSASQNYCLGYVNASNAWQCVSELDRGDDSSSYFGSITELGVYAVLVDDGNLGPKRNNSLLPPIPTRPPTPTRAPTTGSNNPSTTTTGEDMESSVNILAPSLVFVVVCAIFFM